jgi:hypothetical protein
MYLDQMLDIRKLGFREYGICIDRIPLCKSDVTCPVHMKQFELEVDLSHGKN